MGINSVYLLIDTHTISNTHLLVQGKEVKEIAQTLFLSHKTVHVHRANILSKLNLTNNVDVIRFALQHHLLVEG
ncbi:transcriptional regulator UhpA [Vibrio cholerae]|nr:transcriptional regulator UhpA [Vibrio cholerae]